MKEVASYTFKTPASSLPDLEIGQVVPASGKLGSFSYQLPKEGKISRITSACGIAQVTVKCFDEVTIRDGQSETIILI